jgi:hypothetical protein
MNKPALFCLRAAASRAARKAKHFAACYHRHGGPARLHAGLMHLSRRAETLRYAYVDAAWEAQRGGLSKLAA